MHTTAKTKYTVRKIQYKFASTKKSGNGFNTERLIKKYLPVGFMPTVFLQRDLKEIDVLIKSDEALRTFIIEEGERSFNNEWIILNSRRKDMYDTESGHYRWSEDIFTKYHYKSCFYMDARRQVTTKGTDIKLSLIHI